MSGSWIIMAIMLEQSVESLTNSGLLSAGEPAAFWSLVLQLLRAVRACL